MGSHVTTQLVVQTHSYHGHGQELLHHHHGGLVMVCQARDRKFQYMGLYENTSGPLQKLSCTAKVSSSSILLDVCYMECSVSCGKLENCGAYFVKEDSGYQCFLIELDDDGDYKNKADLVESTSVKYYYSMQDYE